MAKDLQKKVIIVVLLVVIILSALGTWTILEAGSTSSGRSYVIYEKPVTTAKVSIGIVPGPEQEDVMGGDNSG